MYKSVLLVLVILASFDLARAQLGNIKDAVKQKTEKPVGEKPEPAKQGAKQAEAGGSAGTMSATFGVLDDVLMDYINFNYDNRRIFIEQARAMHLSTDGADVKVTMKIKSANGGIHGTYESNAQAPKRNKSFWMQGFSGIGGTESTINLPGAGDYLVEFSSGGKVFDHFPFSIKPYTGDKGQSWFVMDGLWNDHAMIDTSRDVLFNIWMRDMLEGTGKRNINYGRYSAKIVRQKDGKVIGITNHPETTTLAPMRKWTRYKIPFAKNNIQTPIGIYDITAQDGAYVIEFMHDGKLYGKYPFAVQSGKLKGVSEFRENSLETQDGDYTWMKREGGQQ